MGRRPHTPTPQQRAAVIRYASSGVSQNRIAEAIGISDECLRRHYRAELDEAAGRWEADFEQTIGQVALDPDPKNNVLRIFLAKSRLGYRELVAKDPDKLDVDNLTDDQLRAVVAERARESRSESGRGDTTPEDGEAQPSKLRA